MNLNRILDGLLPRTLVRVLPAATITLVLVAMVTSKVVENSFRQHVQANLEKDARFGAETVTSKLNAILSSIRSVAANDLVLNGLVDTEAREAYVPLYFTQLQIAGIRSGAKISFTDYRGRLIASNWPSKGYVNANWLYRVIDNRREYMRFDSNGAVLVVPVIYQGKSEGAIVIELGKRQLAQIISISFGASAVLISSKGGELFSSSPEISGIFQPGKKSTEGWIQFTAPVNGFPDIHVTVAERTDIAFAVVYKAEKMLFLTLVIALIALAAGIVSTAYLTTNPLTTFAKELKRFGVASDLDRRILPAGASELRDLANSFNSMLERLQKTVVSNEQLEGEIELRKRAEEIRSKARKEIRDKEARTHAIVDTALEGIITIDDQGRIESFNRAATTIFGYPPEEVIGKNIKILMPEPFHSKHDGYLQHYHETGTPSDTSVIGTVREVEGCRKDGSVFPMDLAVSPMSISGKQMFAGLIRDITDRKNAEVALQEQNERFNVALENMTHGLCVFDKDNRLVVCNERYATMYGLSPDFVKPGVTLHEIVEERIEHGIFAGESLDDYIQDRISSGNNSDDSEAKVQELSDGRTIRISREPLSDGGWVTTHEDITEIKRMERLEHDQNERFSVALENMSQGLSVFDRNQRLIISNERYATMYGLSPELMQPGISMSEIVRQRIVNGFYAGESPEEYVEERRMWALDSNKKEKVQEFSDGRTIRVSRQTLSDGGWVATHEDITETMRMERLKNEFVSVVSHELRTPLTSLSGSLTLLNSGAMGALPDKAKSLLDIADRNTKRLALLVNDILDMEKIKSDSMDFNSAATDTIALAQWAIDENSAYGLERGVSFRLEQTVETAYAMVDKNRMMQVLANLLSNAAKFSSPGSEVILRISKENSKIRYAVIDTGCGIPKDKQSLLFERFFQVDGSDTRSKQGTGLGLAIVKAIIDKHGGQIQVDSEMGRGSTFFFDLEEVEAPSEVENGPEETTDVAVA